MEQKKCIKFSTMKCKGVHLKTSNKDFSYRMEMHRLTKKSGTWVYWLIVG